MEEVRTVIRDQGLKNTQLLEVMAKQQSEAQAAAAAAGRPPDIPLAAAVATVSPTPQEAELTPEERSEILRNLDQQQSVKKIGWMPEIPASRPSDKIDRFAVWPLPRAIGCY